MGRQHCEDLPKDLKEEDSASGAIVRFAVDFGSLLRSFCMLFLFCPTKTAGKRPKTAWVTH